jgi:hypothetical protein
MISPDYEGDAAVLQKVAPVAAEMNYCPQLSFGRHIILLTSA